MEPFDLPPGEEFSKLIMHNHILKNDTILSEEEKIKLALKYQLLIKGTSLFGEIELSEKKTSQIVQIEIEQDNKKTIDYIIAKEKKRLEILEQKEIELMNEVKKKIKK